ncbi:MAG TPA: hypothetical protein VFL80_07420, partial [Thermoanaerobaculia bacterium]|nr:hypothetical protein [Thermoanaerobaculia bacterium]
VLLRWLVISEVRVIAEILVASGAFAILAAFRPAYGPLAVFASLASVLMVPGVPLRTVAILFLIALGAAALRFGRLRILNVPAVAATVGMLMLFSWSGVVARGFGYFLRSEKQGQRLFVGTALPAGQSIPVETPPNSAWLIVSGANVPRFGPDSILGVIQPGGIPITIADAADWGYMRRQHSWSSRNVLPRHPAGELRDYGYSAWVDGAGRVMIPPGARSITVTASRALPPQARLQIHAVELR